MRHAQFEVDRTNERKKKELERKMFKDAFFSFGALRCVHLLLRDLRAANLNMGRLQSAPQPILLRLRAYDRPEKMEAKMTGQCSSRLRFEWNSDLDTTRIRFLIL